MPYKADRRQQQRREERPQRSLSPQEAMQVPGRYVVQYGRGRPQTEFCRDHNALVARLCALWSRGHSEANGREVTWSDVVVYWQGKL